VRVRISAYVCLTRNRYSVELVIDQTESSTLDIEIYRRPTETYE